jgi:hypothetical protein
MIRRTLRIGRWLVYFFFAPDGYDKETILSFLDTFGASDKVMARAGEIMEDGYLNRGFTFSNADLRRALVVIGPTSSGAEFQDSFSHEVRHLANAIAESIGYELDAEEPSYLTGDTVRELAEVVCNLGCDRC